MSKYQCDECGECCRQLIVEIEEIDILREPKLIQLGVKPFRDPVVVGYDYTDDDTGEDLGPQTNGYEPGAMLACGAKNPCPALDGKRCSIYPSRPNVCVAFRAGSGQCQDARAMAGLGRLEPVANGSVL